MLSEELVTCLLLWILNLNSWSTHYLLSQDEFMKIFFLCWIWVTLQLRLSQLCSLSLYVDAEGSSLLVVLGVISSLHFPSTKDQFISPTSLLIFRIYLLFCIASISLIEGLLCSIPCFHLVLTQHRRRFCSTGRDKKIYKIEKDMKCTFWLFLLVPLWFLNC